MTTTTSATYKTRDASFLLLKMLMKFHWRHSQRGRRIREGYRKICDFRRYLRTGRPCCL